MVTLYDLENSSPLLSAGDIVYPYHSFQAHIGVVTGKLYSNHLLSAGDIMYPNHSFQAHI